MLPLELNTPYLYHTGNLQLDRTTDEQLHNTALWLLSHSTHNRDYLLCATETAHLSVTSFPKHQKPTGCIILHQRYNHTTNTCEYYATLIHPLPTTNSTIDHNHHTFLTTLDKIYPQIPISPMTKRKYKFTPKTHPVR